MAQFPAIVEIMPAVSIFRTQLLPPEYKLPAVSPVIDIGVSAAEIAGPPSPDGNPLPLPATVVMMPVAKSMRRSRELPLSATYKILLRSGL